MRAGNALDRVCKCAGSSEPWLPVAYGVSTQLQPSGLVAHKNSTFRNLALAVSRHFMA